MRKIELVFAVNQQTIQRADQTTVAADSAGVLYGRFTFSGEWDGLFQWACVSYGGNMLEEPIVDGICKIPEYCIKSPGFMIGVVGRDRDGTILFTTNRKQVPVTVSSYSRKPAPVLEPTESYVKTVAGKVFHIKQDEDGGFMYEISPDVFKRVDESVDYEKLVNLPQINGSELKGNVVLETPQGAQSKANTALNSAKAYTDLHSGNQDVHVTATDKASWNHKVDQETGKGLSSNDYTDAEKLKLQELKKLPAGGLDGQVLTTTSEGMYLWQTRETAAGAQAKVDTHAANAVLHPSAEKKAEWDAKLGGANIQAGRNVTLDRVGQNIIINSEGGGGSGEPVANADTVDGYHVDDTKGGTNEDTDNALWTAHKIQSVARGSKVFVAPETPAPTMENGDVWLITEDLTQSLRAVAYSNMVYAAQEPAAAENWGKVEFVNGKLKVNDEPENSYEFFGDTNATE